MHVTLYHGTTSMAVWSIYKRGLVPNKKREFVYLTSSYERAVYYAWVTTGGILYDLCLFHGGPQVPVHDGDWRGVVYTLRIPAEKVFVDHYSESEPDQYAYKGRIPRRYMVEYTILDNFERGKALMPKDAAGTFFKGFGENGKPIIDESEALRAACFHIGSWRAEDSVEDTPEAKALNFINTIRAPMPKPGEVSKRIKSTRSGY